MTLIEAAQHVLDRSVAAGIPLDGYNKAHYSNANNAANVIELYLNNRNKSEVRYTDASYSKNTVKTYLFHKLFTVRKITPTTPDPNFWERYKDPGAHPIYYITLGKKRMVLITEKDPDKRRGHIDPVCRTISDRKIRNDVYIKMLYLFSRVMRDPLALVKGNVEEYVN